MNRIACDPTTSGLVWKIVCALLVIVAGATACGDGSEPGYEYAYCDQGTIRTATCHDGICDPTPYDDCGGGTCVLRPAACTKPAAQTFRYCDQGTIRTATCQGGICDPAPYDDCGDGTCVLRPAACSAR